MRFPHRELAGVLNKALVLSGQGQYSAKSFRPTGASMALPQTLCMLLVVGRTVRPLNTITCTRSQREHLSTKCFCIILWIVAYIFSNRNSVVTHFDLHENCLLTDRVAGLRGHF